MQILHTIAEAKTLIQQKKAKGLSVGLVPTMGYLHEGHLSLIRQSAAQNDVTAVSIFVNPTQFGANEDLDKYPRDLERDARLAEEAGADILFCPAPEEMYPQGYLTYVAVEDITTRLCGVTRPTHFRGVTTVVCKLFHIFCPNRAYFGMKDAQQYLVLRRMLRDLNMEVTLVPCPIVREPDGLAMSSRNVYLSPEERKQALCLSRSLSLAQKAAKEGERSAAVLTQLIRAEIAAQPLADIDYIELVDMDTLLPVDAIRGDVLAALAVRFGNTRLIDNCVLSADAE